MYSGVRLSQLAVGEPLLNVNWEYKELKGKAAVEVLLETLEGFVKNFLEK